MPRLLPADYDPVTTGRAEREVFRALAESAIPGIVLHSLHLPKTVGQVQGETDFLLITSRGILCIEVKGGAVSQEDGVWYFGSRREPGRSPFTQAETAMHAVIGILRDHRAQLPPGTAACLVGYGVVFPHISFGLRGADDTSAVREVILDRRRGLGDIESYVARCLAYWEARTGRSTALTKEQVNAIGQVLRGNFDLVPPIGYWIEETERGLAREEADEQLRYLDVIEEEPRILLRGVAGSGKTSLSLEYARRRVLAGDSVLFVCFNKNLRGYLEGSLDPRVHVWAFHDLLEADLPPARRPAVPDDDGGLGEYFERLLPEAYSSYAVETGGQSKFDCLVVDEGQDLLRPAYVRCMDQMLNGGLKSGRWQICYDPAQDIYTRSAADAVQRLRAEVPHHRYQLRVNCRNTAAIAVYNELLTGMDCGRTRLRLYRPEVAVQYYEDRKRQIELVRSTVENLLAEGVTRRQIVLLGRHTLRNSCLQDDPRAFGSDLPVLELGNKLTRKKLDAEIIKYCTIWGFKGIDAPVVLLLDVDDLSDRHLLHTAISRARTALYVFIRSDLRAEHDARAGGYRQALSEARRTSAPNRAQFDAVP